MPTSRIFPSGKKKLLSSLLFSSGCPLERLLIRYKNKKNNVWVLAYHSIKPSSTSKFPFNEEIISATPEMFDEQMRWVSQHFQVINQNQLRAYQQGHLDFDKPLCMITFDDGYADNAEFALPILKKFGLTATVFVTTSAIDNQELFWFDKVAYWINFTTPRTLTLDEGRFVTSVTELNRKQVRRLIGLHASTISEPRRQRFLQQLEEQCELTITEELAALAKPLTWNQVRQWVAEGMEVGSHTVTHGFLDQMSATEIEHELLLTKQRITQETGVEPISLSYPTGKYSKTVQDIAMRLGYQLAYSYHHQATNLNTLNASPYSAFEIPRLHVNLDVGMPLFKANILLHRWFCD